MLISHQSIVEQLFDKSMTKLRGYSNHVLSQYQSILDTADTKCIRGNVSAIRHH